MYRHFLADTRTNYWHLAVGAVFVAIMVACGQSASPPQSPQPRDSDVRPFTNVAHTALQNGHFLWNDRPGVVVFDYDRDGDQDLYLTQRGGSPNLLYRNDGDATFTNVAEEAGVSATASHSTGAVACDINNDGYQDLYVGAWGDREDGLGFRSPSEGQGNTDSLFLNNGDGTFTDITQSSLGDDVNIRSATSMACADVDSDGWLDIYVGNLMSDDFRSFGSASHPGHYNVLYRNNGDLTFSEVAKEAGVTGPQILMQRPDGSPIVFNDPVTNQQFVGYDPTQTDSLGNRIGEPTGQTHAVLFMDYDDDGDQDLWLANDGDRLHVFRNDSVPGKVRFTPVSGLMGVDKVGAWMGFAVGDYDGDSDLDVFVTNMGYHSRTRMPVEKANGSCEYHEQFAWGTCLHFLLKNDGTRETSGLGTVGVFSDVAAATAVDPSPYMPPKSLDASEIHPRQEAPSGLAAYDFGFGATFFDYENDGDQDLYWIGSTVARGEAPGGQVFPAAGRMLRRNHDGKFEDITVRAHLLDISDVYYRLLGQEEHLRELRIDAGFHENGKGLAHGDLNGDGYVDLIGTNSSGDKYRTKDPSLAMTEKAPGPVFVWMNGGGNNHWIVLRLKGRMAVDGTGSNADGIGARVYVKTLSAEEEPMVQVQEVRAGSSYLSMDSVDLEFGIGAATIVEEIKIHWPSGREQTLVNVAADQVVDVVEPPS